MAAYLSESLHLAFPSPCYLTIIIFFCTTEAKILAVTLPEELTCTVPSHQCIMDEGETRGEELGRGRLENWSEDLISL